jgi:two-component system NtrC family sensor kinase
VAGRRSLRQKLLLVLGLMLGIFALSLAGTLSGLTSYTSTLKITDGKSQELVRAESLRNAIRQLTAPVVVGQDEVEADKVIRELAARVEQARTALSDYRAIRRATHASDEFGEGFQVAQVLEAMQAAFGQLDQAVARLAQTQIRQPGRSLLEDERLLAAHEQLLAQSNLLWKGIFDEMYWQFDVSKRQARKSLTVVLTASGAALVLVSVLLYYFSRWIFHPIEQLQAGVKRVAGGDFEHPIELHSRDELEELATAFNDMTARLHAIYRDLARQVNERSRQLVRSERLVSVGFLAAGVAHEINNPLASIAFCAEALERRLADLIAKSPREGEILAKYLGMIRQEAFRCKEITQQLLEFSRVGERRRDPTDLAELIQRVLEVAQHLQNCKGKQIIFQPTAHLIALVNPQDMKSVVLNLVVNALDSMDEGGTLTIRLLPYGTTATIIFSDTGCGMPPEILETIFEPFFTRSRTGKGTGLGLFICHQIIDQHGGSIEASSPGPGQGSTFTVRLPLYAIGAGTINPAPVSVSGNGGNGGNGGSASASAGAAQPAPHGLTLPPGERGSTGSVSRAA